MTPGPRPAYWYRLLVLAYPRWWRQRHGDELVSSLLDLVDGQGRRRPGLRDVVDVLAHGLACRVSTPVAALPARTRSVGGALGLASGAATSLVLLALGDRPELTASAGPAVFAGWLLALATAVAGPAWLGRAVLAGTTAVGAAAPVVLSATPLGAALTRPPLTILGFLTLCGLLALLQPGCRPARRDVLVPAAALTALVAGPLLWHRQGVALFSRPLRDGELQRALSLSALLVAMLLAAAAVAAAARRSRAAGAGAALAALPWLAFGLLLLQVTAPPGELRPTLTGAAVATALLSTLGLRHLGLRLRVERLPSGPRRSA